MKEIILSDGTKTQVDDEDYDLNKHSYQLYGSTNPRYAGRKINIEKKVVFLHQEIIERMGKTVPEGYDIDHEDQNPLNNQRSNLRIVSKSQNQHNSKIHSNNTSGHKGVHFDKKKNKYLAYITVNRKHIHLGCFDLRKDAIKVRQRAERLFFPEIYKGD